MPKSITSTTYGSMHISFARQNTVVNIYRTGLIPTLIPDPASPPSRSRLARESDWFFSLAIFLTRWFSAVAGFLPRTRARPDQFWISPSRAGFPDRQLQKLASILSVTRARPDDCHPLIWMLKTCVTARELTRQSA